MNNHEKGSSESSSTIVHSSHPKAASNSLQWNEEDDHSYGYPPPRFVQKITPEEYQRQAQRSYQYVEKMLESASMDELLKSRELARRFQVHGFLKKHMQYTLKIREVLYMFMIILGICIPFMIIQFYVIRACINLYLWDHPVEAIRLGLNRMVLNRYYGFGFAFQNEEDFSKEQQVKVLQMAVELDSVEFSERLIALFHQVYKVDQRESWELYMKKIILKKVTSLEMLEMITNMYGKTVKEILDLSIPSQNGTISTLRNVILENLLKIFRTPGLTLKEFKKHDRLFQRMINR
ncbi:hypothetical protein FDP41_005027 [Naegleria fowleri]|uniref:Uncharacterized protein n=1 Tax=Naegleria fowleri TaxID=5763 RepID=A0A6A5BP23_NAEFO|nr:uncharacterized protein FDP41_005027 [Naegleria fowleri]KAF0975700.1 hypothetical protein FDP41_005027 [Naegleria fowleri]CAG4719185.1 unnamed protein product [Naegleria fowleri]